MANDTATDVPGWVSLCGSVAPFAALVVILAVSFSKQGCDRNALSIQLSTDSDALQPLLILALSNYPKNTERAKCQISPSSTLFFYDCQFFPVVNLWITQERTENLFDKPLWPCQWHFLLLKLCKIFAKKGANFAWVHSPACECECHGDSSYILRCFPFTLQGSGIDSWKCCSSVLCCHVRLALGGLESRLENEIGKEHTAPIYFGYSTKLFPLVCVWSLRDEGC